MKRLMSILSLILILNIFLSGCATKAVIEPVDPIQDLAIIHWNDFHSANLSYKPTYRNREGIYAGGYANLAGYIDSLRNVYANNVVLNAGDDFQGSPVSSMTKGLSQILVLNEIQPAAFTIGNHEFDYGFEGLKNAKDLATFDIVSCNLYDEATNKTFVEPYKILTEGHVKVGIIGLILDGLESTVMPQNMGTLTVLNSVEQVNKCVAEIKDKTDIIIVLSHQGFYEDSLLATQVTEVDAIIGGHSHTWLRKPVSVNNILVCQVGSKGERLGLLKTKVNLDENRFVSHDYEFIRTVKGKVKSNDRVARVVDSLESIIEKEMNTKIADLKTDWIRSSRGESNIGNWICDATLKEFNADVVFTNSGGIRKNQNAGPLLNRDIWEISPFDNTVMLVKVTGKQLNGILQWRLDNPRDFLQTAGLRVEYDSQTRKILKATVGGQPIDDEKIYTIATNNYITGHIDRFFGLTAKDVEISETGVIGRDILLKAAREQKVIDSRLDGRLTDRSR